MTNKERWFYYLDTLESPDLFIEWTLMATISAALRRRVSIFGKPYENKEQLYANIYPIFIGPPGVGKTSAAKQAKKLFTSFDTFDKQGRPVQLIKRGPDSTTLEALTKFLHNNFETQEIPEAMAGKKGAIYFSSPLAFFCGDELGSLMRENTHDLITFLNQGWDGGNYRRETKQNGNDDVMHMCLTLLGAATPDWVYRVSRTGLLNEGFTARAIFVFGDRPRKLSHKYVFTPAQEREFEQVRKHIELVTKLFGEVIIPPHVDKWVNDWYQGGGTRPLNNDKHLADYYGRKKVHIYKSAMLCHFTESTEMELTIADFEAALDLHARTEVEMHKALMSSGVNPVHNIAMGILRFLGHQQGGTAGHKITIMQFHDEGPVDQIVGAVEFLRHTGQISVNQVGSEIYYTLKEKPTV